MVVIVDGSGTAAGAADVVVTTEDEVVVAFSAAAVVGAVAEVVEFSVELVVPPPDEPATVDLAVLDVVVLDVVVLDVVVLEAVTSTTEEEALAPPSLSAALVVPSAAADCEGASGADCAWASAVEVASGLSSVQPVAARMSTMTTDVRIGCGFIMPLIRRFIIRTPARAVGHR